MANTSSAKKAARKISTRTEVNRNRRGRVRTFLRKVEEALAAGDRAAAVAALKAAEPEIMRAASKGVVTCDDRMVNCASEPPCPFDVVHTKNVSPLNP